MREMMLHERGTAAAAVRQIEMGGTTGRTMSKGMTERERMEQTDRDLENRVQEFVPSKQL